MPTARKRGSGMDTAAVEAGARRRRCQDGRHGAGEAAGEQREKLRGRLTGDEERRASSGSSQMTNGVFFPLMKQGARLGPS